MKVVGVIDLVGGRAVHARGGRRELYAPVGAVAGRAIPDGDPMALAREYVGRLQVDALYAADLDAILGRPPQDALVRALATTGTPLWVDAGVSDAARAVDLRALGAHRVIVGLETLESYRALERICAAVGGPHTAFSLDLRAGRPLADRMPSAREERPEAIATRAAAAGAGAIIVLDLARVGMHAGADPALLRRVRDAAPAAELLAGGGVRGPEDLEALAHAGCDGVLMASALLSGAVGPPWPRAVASVVPDRHRA